MKKLLLVIVTLCIVAISGCTKEIITPSRYENDGGSVISPQAGSRTTGSMVINDTAFIKNVIPVSGYINNTVAVGQQIKTIGSFLVKAGSAKDKISGVDVLIYDRKGNRPLSVFASNVCILLNGKWIGSLPSTSFNQTKDGYMAFIPVGDYYNPVYFSHSSDVLSIAVTALPVIDAGILGVDHSVFSSEVPVIRYQVGNVIAKWYVPTQNQLDVSFSFVSALIQNPIKVTISKDGNDMNDHTVQGSYVSITQSVTLGRMDCGINGGNVIMANLPVMVTNSSALTGLNTIFSKLYLYNSSGQLIDSEYAPSGSNTVIFKNFPNGGVYMPAGTTNVFTVKGDVRQFGGMFAPGIAVSMNVTATDIDAYDENHNRLPKQSFSGSVIGSKLYFYAKGINVSPAGNTTNTYSNPGGSAKHGTFTMTIPFFVTAYGTTAYIPSVAKLATVGFVNDTVTVSAGPYIQYAIDNGSALQSSGASAAVVYTGNDVLMVDNNGNYQIPVGQTKNFKLVITFTASSVGSYRGRLVNVNYNTSDSAAAYSSFVAGLNTNQFRTPYVAGQ